VIGAKMAFAGGAMIFIGWKLFRWADRGWRLLELLNSGNVYVMEDFLQGKLKIPPPKTLAVCTIVGSILLLVGIILLIVGFIVA
jgi:hypothetical protein